MHWEFPVGRPLHLLLCSSICELYLLLNFIIFTRGCLSTPRAQVPPCAPARACVRMYVCALRVRVIETPSDCLACLDQTVYQHTITLLDTVTPRGVPSVSSTAHHWLAPHPGALASCILCSSHASCMFRIPYYSALLSLLLPTPASRSLTAHQTRFDSMLSIINHHTRGTLKALYSCTVIFLMY